ncbi:MAG: MarR family winged helix-turn-helix transcriptional regulator [Lachnotalea sp.]
MGSEKTEQIVLNMVNFYILFEKEFMELVPIINIPEITPMLSRMLNEIHLQGKTTSSELSKHLNLSLPNTSRAVNTLYQLGYINKTQDVNDKRIGYITLSIEGVELVKQFLVIYQEKFFEKLSHLSEAEIEHLNESFSTIKDLFIKMREVK